ncbi:MAG: hypothetical protein ACQGVC_22395 [Myxococcota bacterium]
MKLTAAQIGYLFVGHCLLAIAINLAINGGIGWLAFEGVDPVPVWGASSSAGPDLIGTCFFLPLFTCLIVTPIVRRHVRGGRVTPIPAGVRLPFWVRAFRRRLVPRALSLGLACLAVVGGGLAALLLASGLETVGNTPFLWWKATFSAGLAAVVQPAIAVIALSDPEPAPAAGAA